jgi:transcriptional regulator with XRE-family HTH domain
MSKYDRQHAQEFGVEIKRFREAKGLSLRKLALEVKISSSYLSYLERGIHGPPSIDVTKKLASALGVNQDKLLASAGHIDPEVSEVIRKNPEKVSLAIRAIGNKSDHPINYGTFLSFFMFRLFPPEFAEHTGIDIRGMSPHEFYQLIKKLLPLDNEKIDEEKELLHFATEVFEIWEKDVQD